MPQVQHIVALLRGTPLCGSLDSADLAAVAREMQERSFEAGQQLFARGDAGHELFLVVEGRVRLSVMAEDGREVAFSHACDGQIFGEIAVLDGGPRSADARALTRVHAMALSHAVIKRLLECNPRMASAAILFLCNRLRTTSEQLEEVVLSPVEVRVARFLLHILKERNMLGGVSPIEIDLGMSQSELGLLIGSSRQSVNAAITALERIGAIVRGGNRLRCHVPQLLRFLDVTAH